MSEPGFIAGLREIITLLWPVIQKVLQAMRDHEVRAIGQELKSATTLEEKREAARKIAEHLYKR